VISSIVLENFQGFSGKQRVTLAPITFIMGANASGKSSLVRSIKLIAQSRSGKFVFSSPHLDMVDLNHSKFGQEADGELFSVSLELPLHFPVNLKALSHLDPQNKDFHAFPSALGRSTESFVGALYDSLSLAQAGHLMSRVSTLLKMQVTESGGSDGSSEYQDIVVTGFVYQDKESRVRRTIEFSKGIDRDDRPSFASYFGSGSEFVETSEAAFNSWWDFVFESVINADPEARLKYDADERHKRKYNVPVKPWSQLFSERATNLESLGWVFSFSEYQTQREDKIDLKWLFLGALLEVAEASRRQELTHLFEVSGVRSADTKVSDVGWGKRVRETALPLDIDSVKDLTQINKALATLTGGRFQVVQETVLSRTLVSSRDVKETFIHDTLTSARVSFKNVGAGLGHVLPVLNAISIPAISKKVFLEQPELHLHPKAQAHLAEVLVMAVQNGAVEQLFIESHSESMLLRVQKLVRERQIKARNVVVIVAQEEPFAENNLGAKRGNTISNVRLLKNGELEEPLALSFAGLRLDEYL
jgi:energy-coupling factor transporter ATP-binding protein EcfA2